MYNLVYQVRLVRSTWDSTAKMSFHAELRFSEREIQHEA